MALAASPLTALSQSVQNTKHKITTSPVRLDYQTSPENGFHEANSSENKVYAMMTQPQDPSEDDEYHDSLSSTPTPLTPSTKRLSCGNMQSPIKFQSPVKIQAENGRRESPMSPPSESTLRFDKGLITPMGPVNENQREGDDDTLHRANEGMSTIMNDKSEADEQQIGDETEFTLSIDDTMDDISTFSAIPDADLTRFAALRNSAVSPTKVNGNPWSPSKQLQSAAPTTPGTARRPLHLSTRAQNENSFDNDATPRRPYSTPSPEDLLNFTGASNIFMPPPQSSSRDRVRRSPSGRVGFPIRINPSPTHRSQASVDRERSRGIISPVKEPSITPLSDRRTNLLDFDLEPLATPRSIPSVTPRELESLRSELSSQISSLSATLSGKEAEVLALKRSITDAEVRVGNTSEELRNEQSLRESLEQEKRDWDRRGREMETVLREIRQEIMIGEHERDKLRRQTDEAEKRTEDMEVTVVELRTRLESANRRTTLSPTSSPKKGDTAPGEPVTPAIKGNGLAAMDINEAVREATERVARDLHALYKSKHETKVAALKKSYEARWEKRVRQLEEELKSANAEVLHLKTERDATMTGPYAISPAAAAAQHQQQLDDQRRVSENLAKQNEQMEAAKQMLGAKVAGLESEIDTLKQQTELVRAELQRERVEKGDLVAQVDLFLAMAEPAADPGPASSPPPTTTTTTIAASASPPRRHKRYSSSSGGPPDPQRLRSTSSSDSVVVVVATPASSTSTPFSSRPNGIDHHPPPVPPHHPQSPARQSLNHTRAATTMTASGRPRPMSLLQPPGKFSGIPGPGARGGGGGHGAAGLKALSVRANGGGGGGGSVGIGGGIMEGIAKMGAGARGGGGGGY